MAVRAYAKSVASYSAWQTLTEYSLEDYRVPTTDNGMCYECTTAGTSGEDEPTWTNLVGQTVQDGTVVWTCREKEALPAALSIQLDARGLGANLKDVWVKSDGEATFYIYGSYDGEDLRLIDTLSVPVGELLSTHKTYHNAYPCIAVGTSAEASNEIEIVVGG